VVHTTKTPFIVFLHFSKVLTNAFQWLQLLQNISPSHQNI
jgi:hypothetical protein